MAEFQQAVLTQKGIDLLAKAQAEQAQIRFTRAVAGSGLYEEDEEISLRESLKTEQQSFAISTISRKNNSNVIIRFAITNLIGDEPLEHGYRVTEVGIMAEDPDDGEILYGIAIAKEGESDYLPAYNDLLPAVISVDFLIEVDNAENVIIQTDLFAYATREDLDAKGDGINYDDGMDELTLTSGGKPISKTIIGIPPIRQAIAALQAIIANLIIRIEQLEKGIGKAFAIFYDEVNETVTINDNDTTYSDETITLPAYAATYIPATALYDRRSETITVERIGASYDEASETISLPADIAKVDGESIVFEEGEVIKISSEAMKSKTSRAERKMKRPNSLGKQISSNSSFQMKARNL